MTQAKTVAVIGASNDHRKFGSKAFRAFLHRGYTAIPINPNEAEVEGHTTYPSVLDVPRPIDVATFYVPADIGVSVMDQVASKGIREVWLNPGADDERVVSRARALGLEVVQTCSIIAIGESPSDY